jgi:CheY-like chemotaxis protein
MYAQSSSFAVRLIGFAPAESARIAAALARAPDAGPAYSVLSEDNLREPDLFVANGDDLSALATIDGVVPSPIRPALIVGAPLAPLPFPQIARPLDPPRMFELLAGLVDARAHALAHNSARGLPYVHERRRRRRSEFDPTDPAQYLERRKPPPSGAVLIVDQDRAVRDHVARLLEGRRRPADWYASAGGMQDERKRPLEWRANAATMQEARKRPVEWTDSATAVLRLCDETPVSLVLVNTALRGVDPYRLCADIKALDGGTRIAVVLLVGERFDYDRARARGAGVRGLLDHPVDDEHLHGVLGKLLSLPA